MTLYFAAKLCLMYIKCHLLFSFFQASMLSTPDGPFINLARLNFAKYAARPNLAKVDYCKLHVI